MSTIKELFALCYIVMVLLGAFIGAGGAAHLIVLAVTAGWDAL